MSIMDCLVSNVVVAAILALVAAVVGRVTTKPQIRHALWVLVLVKLVTPPIVQIPVRYADSEPFVLETALTSDVDSSEQRTVDVPIEVRRDFAASAFPPVVDPEAEKGANAQPALGVPWSKVVIGVWVAGSLMWFLLVGVRLLRFKNVLQCAQPASEDIQAEVRTIARKYGLLRLPRVMVVDAKLPPLICGFGARACMVLPSGLLSKLGTDERAGLLAHELAHLRRYDHWIRWLEFLVLGVHWWNPVAWWARAHVQQAEEECCDAWVLWAFPNKACLYAQTLVETVDYMAGLARRKPEIATAFNQGHSLKRRIEMIVSEKVSRRLSWRTKTVLVLFAAIVTPLSLLGSSSEKTEGNASLREEEAATSEGRESQKTGNDRVKGTPVLSAESEGTATQDSQPASETPEDHLTLQDLDHVNASAMEEAGVYHISPVFKKLVKVSVIKRGGPYGPDHTRTLEGWNYDKKTGRLTVREMVDNEREMVLVYGKRKVPWAWQMQGALSDVKVLIGKEAAVRGEHYEVDEAAGTVQFLKKEHCKDGVHYHISYGYRDEPSKSGSIGNHPDRALVRKFLGLHPTPRKKADVGKLSGTNASRTDNPKVWTMMRSMRSDSIKVRLGRRSVKGTLDWLERGKDFAYDQTLATIILLREIPLEEDSWMYVSGVPTERGRFLLHSELTKEEIKVILGDRLLEEGVGYEVDYEQGIVTIVDKAIEKKGAKYYISAGGRSMGNHNNMALIRKLLQD